MTTYRTTAQLIRIPRRFRHRPYDLALPYTGLGWPFVPGDTAEVTVNDLSGRPLFKAISPARIFCFNHGAPIKCFLFEYLLLKQKGMLDLSLEDFYEFEVRKLNPKRERPQIRDPALFDE